MQLTIPQAAALLRVPEAQILRWIRDRGLPAVLFQEQYRLNRIGLMDWAQRNNIPLPEPDPEELKPSLRLADALERGGIHRGLVGSTRQEVVARAVDELLLPPSIDRDLLREMILARQAHDATAIGDGVALPHARYPFVAEVRTPVLGLFFLAQPLDWGAPDGVPIAALFVLVSPNNHAHLQLLAQIARGLRNGLRQPVQTRATDEVILAAARACDDATHGRKP